MILQIFIRTFKDIELEKVSKVAFILISVHFFIFLNSYFTKSVQFW